MPVELTRRRLLLMTGAAALGLAAARPASAAPDDVAREIEAFSGDREPSPGRVRLIVADRVENGSAVPVTIEVDSAMEGDDRVESIILLAEENPHPVVATFHFTPLSGAAVVSTRIRMAGTQKLVALARMADGEVWSDERHVDVAIGGCVT